MSIQRLRTVLGGLMLAALALLAACGSAPPPAPPPLPEPPPMPPPISLSTAVVQDAAVFQAYMAKAAAISPDFQSGADVAQPLSLGDGMTRPSSCCAARSPTPPSPPCRTRPMSPACAPSPPIPTSAART